MAGFITKLAATEKKNVHDTERRGHNTMLISGVKLDPVSWNGSMWPMSGISVPGSHDCLIGRGGKLIISFSHILHCKTHTLVIASSPSLTGKTNHHPGNIKWRLIIEEKKDEYKKSLRTGKPLIAMEIVRIWRDLGPPGRFLRRNDETGLWDDIGDDDARIKCSQTLRERKESKLRLTKEGVSDKGAARRSLLFEQRISSKRQQSMESESNDDCDDDSDDDDDEDVATKVVVEP
jgi:hypothetical protein